MVLDACKIMYSVDCCFLISPSVFECSLVNPFRKPAVDGGADICSRSDLLQTQGLKMSPMASFHSACKKAKISVGNVF